MPDDEKIDYDRRQESLRREASVYESTYVAGKREGKIEGKIEGKKEAEIEANKKLLEIVINLENQNMSSQTIKTITGLTDIELSNLKNS